MFIFSAELHQIPSLHKNNKNSTVHQGILLEGYTNPIKDFIPRSEDYQIMT